MFQRAIQRFRRGIFRARGVNVGPHCTFGSRVRIVPDAPGAVRLGSAADLQTGAVLEARGGSIVLGANVFVGPYAVVYGQGGVEIGDQTLISMHCCILSSNHSVPPAGVDIRSQPDVLLPTRIGRDVWLGAGVIVLGGVSIGDGCVVGAGAVVTGDLEPGCLAVGVPARSLGPRHR